MRARLERILSAAMLLAGGAIAWRYAVQPDLRPNFSIWPRLIAVTAGQFAATFSTGILKSHALHLAGLLWLAGLGAGLGCAFFLAVGVRFRGRLEAGVFSLGAGLGILALFMAAMGLLGLWSPPLILAILVLGSAASAYAVHAGPPLFDQNASRHVFAAWPERIMALALVALAVFNLFGALSPETFYDALVYHLALPDLYWRHHGFFPTPSNVYSGTPALLQMLYAVGLLLGGETTAKLVHWLFGAATALAVLSFVRRFSSPRAALLAALGFYSMPLVCSLSWKAAVDLGSGFYEFLAAYAVVLCLVESSSSWTAVAGLFTGFVMGIKYQSWPFAGVALAVLAARLLQERKRDPGTIAREVLLFSGACALAAGLWPLKNAVLYGNPLYPFLADRFGGAPAPAWMRAFMNDAGRRDLAAAFGTWAGAKDYLLHPWSATFSNISNDSAIGPLFLLSLPLILLAPYAPAFLILRLLFLLAWAYWSLSSTVTRYFLPALPMAAALWAAGIEEGLRGRTRRAMYALSGLVFCANLYWINLTFYADGLGAASSGLLSRSDFLRRESPAYSNPSFAAEEFVNRNLEPGARLLFLGEARGFHCERDYVVSSFYDRSPLVVWLKESRSAGELRERLRREGITHFLINKPEFARLRDSGRWDLSKEDSARLLDFWRGFTKMIYSDAGSGCSVYEIAAGKDAPRRGSHADDPLDSPR